MKTPANLLPFVEAIGADKACDLFLTLGGAQIYLSTSPRAEAKLAQAVGPDAAAVLGKALGPGYLRIPLAREWTARHLKEQRGLAISQIARTVRADEATVRRWFNGGSHKGQLTLF